MYLMLSMVCFLVTLEIESINVFNFTCATKKEEKKEREKKMRSSDEDSGPVSSS